MIRKAFAALGVFAGVAVAANVAFAAWTADGTGSGSAKAISSAAVTTVSATPTAALYPGGSADLAITIKNTNSYPVRVSQINGNGSITSTTACDVNNGVSFTNQTGTWDVPANSTGTTVTLSGAVHMSNISVDACQNATFTVPVSLVAASNAS
jgi:P pilus assembly chaperone PapD